MLIFAVFTLGYFVGVFTALAIFSPGTKEIEEQEIDALKPIMEMKADREAKGEYKPASVMFSDTL